MQPTKNERHANLLFFDTILIYPVSTRPDEDECNLLLNLQVGKSLLVFVVLFVVQRVEGFC